MKKNMIALAVAAAFAAPVAMADAPTIYGKLNLNIKDSSAEGATVNSTASRLGVKGSEDLGNGLKAVYKVEFALNDVSGDKGSKETISARNQYLGLAGGFGTVLMGKHDTPLKMSQPSDLFNDGAADLGNANMDGNVEVAEDRANDVLAYVSPSFSGVKFVAAAVMGENTTGPAASNDATSIAVMYGSTKKGLYLAAAQTSAENSVAINRFSAQYKANGLTVNAMYSDAQNTAASSAVQVGGQSTTDTQGTVTSVQLGYKIGKFMPKIKMSSVDPELTGADSSTNMAYGLNYSLGKKTTAYIYTVDADKKNTAGGDSSYIGMVHKF